ncbi:MAG TPA: hypothetical protein VGA99_14250, partial [bacterium]
MAALKGIASIFDGIRFRKTMRARLAEHHVSFSVPATIIVPCKGLDPGFEANIQSILEQDYPNYSVILVSESTQDRAFSELEALARGSQIDTTVIVAGPARESSQKIHNLLA